MRLRRALAIALFAVASTVWGQPAGPQDPEVVLHRTEERLLAELARLPRYTCVQTVTRRYYRPLFGLSDSSCPRIIAEHDKRKKEDLPLRSWDRLRLEVAIVDGKDIYSWVGAANFEEGNLEKLAGRGPLGSGDFGTFLNSVFHLAEISYRQEKVVNGRRLLEYSYDVPLAKSEYSVRTSEGWSPTAYSGTLLLDPDASDVAELTVRTAELPESNPSCQYVTDIEYGRTMIHDRPVLVPQETQLNTVDRGGAETLSQTTYEKCREYASKSRILPEGTLNSASATAVSAPSPTPLSPGLHFEARIVTPIDSKTAAAGDPIEAVLRSPIRDKKNGVRISIGARIHGRLLSFEHWTDAFWFFVHLDSIEVNGTTVPLRASPDSYPAIDVSVPPNASAFTAETGHLHLQKLDWRWTTMPYKHSQKDRSVLQAMALGREVEIANGEYPINSSSAAYFHFSVPAGATDVRLEGAFGVIDPPAKDLEITPKDVEMFLVTKKEFENWQRGNPPVVLYSGGRVKNGILDLSLPSEAETYYLVFDNDAFKKNQQSLSSNDHLLNPPRRVHAVLRLRYNF